ncbi:uncharacterized protein LOC143229623 isoform X4 [Tachypleus tridentatus]|uniref:uncharacterized protein LOC143229623 isoform X4 n=1 Tax=Tachypleus tridentatus TaxID=6853 RepID=UPI003FD06621
MEILKIKSERLSANSGEEDDLFDMKMVKNDEENFVLWYSEGISLEERSRIICKFGVKKEEREENYDEVPVKTENTHVRVQSDESGDTQQDEIISGFNENDGDNIDSKDEILCAIKGKETQDDCQQVDCGSETFPGNILMSATEFWTAHVT